METKAFHIDHLRFTLFALSILLCRKYVTWDISVQKIKYLSINDIFLVYKTHLPFTDQVINDKTCLEFIQTTNKCFICPYEKL